MLKVTKTIKIENMSLQNLHISFIHSFFTKRRVPLRKHTCLEGRLTKPLIFYDDFLFRHQVMFRGKDGLKKMMLNPCNVAQENLYTEINSYSLCLHYELRDKLLTKRPNVFRKFRNKLHNVFN